MSEQALAALSAGPERAERLAERWERAYAEVFRQAARSASRRFEELAPAEVLQAASWAAPDPDELVSEEEVQAALEKASAELKRKALSASTERAAEALGVSFELASPAAEALLAQVGQRAPAVVGALKEELARITQEAFREGFSVQRTAGLLWEAADPGSLTAAQAHALARTDLNMVANGASLRLAKKAKAAEFKQWLTAGDDRVRDMHVDANGQVVPIGQPFSVGGESLQHPGDPAGSPENVFNCRCTIVYTNQPAALLAAAEGGSAMSAIDTTTGMAAAVTVLVEEGAEGLEAGQLVETLSQLLADVATFASSAQGCAWNVQGSDFSEHRSLFVAIHADTAESLDQIAETIRQLGAQPPFALEDLIRLRSFDDTPELGTAFDMSVALRSSNEKVLGLLGRAHALATASEEAGLAGFLAERIEAHQRWDFQLRSTLTAAAVTITVGEEGEAEAAPAPAALRWVSDVAFEGVATADGRFILPGALEWRDPPLTLMALLETGPGGHEGAFAAGRMDSFEKDSELDMEGQPLPEGVVALRSSGIFDLGGEEGSNVARLVDDEFVRGISVDLAVEEWLFRDPETGELLDPAEMDEAAWERAFFGELQLAYKRAVVLAATVCPTPAFDHSRIAVTASGEKRARLWAPLRLVSEPLTASAAGMAPEAPPREWFEMPEAKQPTPLTVTEEGQVFGPMALWASCHTGYPGQCVPPPRSPSGYAYFNRGEVECADGSRVAAGAITLDTLHAETDRATSGEQARAHYEKSGVVAAYVRAQDGKHGIWVAGALRPGLSEQHARDLMGAKPSGDWRPLGRGGREMIGVLAVNVPGFPVPRLVASALLPSGARASFEFGVPADDVVARRRIEVLAASAAADPIAELAALAGVSD